MDDLCEELGDLLLQVVFHAQIAADSGHFTLADVAEGIVAKMIRRHPHVFAGESATTPAAVRANWEDIKAAEKPRTSALDGVALAFPALTRAEKLGRRAARAGFDWPDAAGPRAKIDEELAELAEATTPAAVAEEAGDLLFAVVNYLRHLGVDAEGALRAGNAKFERRFRAMEAHPDYPALDLAGREALWRAAKGRES
jgi:ATP diphosphatase